MPQYRLYYLGNKAKIAKAIDVECREDLEALEKARILSDANEIEIWEGARHVARVKVGDADLDEGDRSSL